MKNMSSAVAGVCPTSASGLAIHFPGTPRKVNTWIQFYGCLTVELNQESYDYLQWPSNTDFFKATVAAEAIRFYTFLLNQLFGIFFPLFYNE